MAIHKHVLTDADTLKGLGALYDVPWQEIADYNGLAYPYTLTTAELLTSLYAHGYLTITKKYDENALTLEKGALFSTEVDIQGITKRYQVTASTTILAKKKVGYVHVRCMNDGNFGNTIAHSICRAIDIPEILKVTNEQAFTNGTDARVRMTGQVIYIPQAQHVEQSPPFFADMEGEDILLTEDGDLMDDGFGDLRTVTGIENIAQSVRHRILTRRGDLPHHPEYGSRLYELVGKAHLPYVNKLIEIDIHETLSHDDRLGEITIQSIHVEGTSVSIDLHIQVVGGRVEVAIKENITGKG